MPEWLLLLIKWLLGLYYNDKLEQKIGPFVWW